MTADAPRPTRLDAIRALLERRQRDGTTHYEGCEAYHIDCAARRLLEVVEAVMQTDGTFQEKRERLNAAVNELEKEALP